MSGPVVSQAGTAAGPPPWRDPSRPAAERVADLLARMTLEEKVAQLGSVWPGDQPRDSNVAPMQGEFGHPGEPFAELIRHGLGQLTRVFGTRSVPPADAARRLRELQVQVAAASRFGIPAVAHEECLTGFAAWTATIFPTPLAWGASFDPDLVGEMAAAIGASMRAAGVHQVLVTGRPYAIGAVAGKLAAAVQAFFPGEEGGGAIAGVLSGRVVPSGRLPAGMPAAPGGQPAPYLRPRLAGPHPGSSVDPTPLFAFGHGLSYTSFAYSHLIIDEQQVATDGTAVISCTVRNTGARAGAEVVQLYLSDPVAQVVRPERWLAGFARVPLEPGQAARITFRLHADRIAFTGRDPSTGTRVVEPGEIRVAIGGASDQLPLRGSFTLTGPERAAGPARVLDTPAEVAAQ